MFHWHPISMQLYPKNIDPVLCHSSYRSNWKSSNSLSIPRKHNSNIRNIHESRTTTSISSQIITKNFSISISRRCQTKRKGAKPRKSWSNSLFPNLLPSVLLYSFMICMTHTNTVVVVVASKESTVGSSTSVNCYGGETNTKTTIETGRAFVTAEHQLWFQPMDTTIVSTVVGQEDQNHRHHDGAFGIDHEKHEGPQKLDQRNLLLYQPFAETTLSSRVWDTILPKRKSKGSFSMAIQTDSTDVVGAKRTLGNRQSIRKTLSSPATARRRKQQGQQNRNLADDKAVKDDNDDNQDNDDNHDNDDNFTTKTSRPTTALQKNNLGSPSPQLSPSLSPHEFPPFRPTLVPSNNDDVTDDGNSVTNEPTENPDSSTNNNSNYEDVDVPLTRFQVQFDYSTTNTTDEESFSHEKHGYVDEAAVISMQDTLQTYLSKEMLFTNLYRVKLFILDAVTTIANTTTSTSSSSSSMITTENRDGHLRRNQVTSSFMDTTMVTTTVLFAGNATFHGTVIPSTAVLQSEQKYLLVEYTVNLQKYLNETWESDFNTSNHIRINQILIRSEFDNASDMVLLQGEGDDVNDNNTTVANASGQPLESSSGQLGFFAKRTNLMILVCVFTAFASIFFAVALFVFRHRQIRARGVVSGRKGKRRSNVNEGREKSKDKDLKDTDIRNSDNPSTDIHSPVNLSHGVSVTCNTTSITSLDRSSSPSISSSKNKRKVDLGISAASSSLDMGLGANITGSTSYSSSGSSLTRSPIDVTGDSGNCTSIRSSTTAASSSAHSPFYNVSDIDNEHEKMPSHYYHPQPPQDKPDMRKTNVNYDEVDNDDDIDSMLDILTITDTASCSGADIVGTTHKSSIVGSVPTGIGIYKKTTNSLYGASVRHSSRHSPNSNSQSTMGSLSNQHGVKSNSKLYDSSLLYFE